MLKVMDIYRMRLGEDDLSPADRDVLTRVVNMHDVRNKFSSSPKASQGFILMSRETPNEPMALFGSPMKQMILNRVSIYAPEVVGDDVRPGTEIISLLASESALLEIMSRRNTSETQGFMTLDRVGGVEVPRYDAYEPSVIDAMRDYLIKDNRRDVVKRLSEVTGKDLSTKSSKSDIIGLISRLKTGDHKFFAGIIAEQADKRNMRALVDASFAAVHASEFAAPQRAAKAISPNLDLAAAITERVSDRSDDNGAKARAILSVLKRLGSEMGHDDYDPLEKDWSLIAKHPLISEGAAYANDDLKSIIVTLRGLKSKSRKDAARDFRQMSGRVSQISGNHVGLHSDYAQSHDVVTFSVSTGANIACSFGDTSLDDLDGVIEVAMSSAALMEAFRGSPTGEPLRCDITRLGEHIVKRTPWAPEFMRSSKVEIGPTETEKRHNKAVSEVISKVNVSGLGTAAERKEHAEAIRKIAGEAEDAFAAYTENVLRTAEDVMGVYNDELRKKVEKITTFANGRLSGPERAAPDLIEKRENDEHGI